MRRSGGVKNPNRVKSWCRCRGWAMVVALALTMVATAPTSQAQESAFERGMRLFQEGEPAAAEAAFFEAMEAAPRSVDVRERNP